MILVMVGTHPQPFDRLLKEVDRLVGKKKIRETVFAQTGCSSFVPKNFPSKRMLSLKEYKLLIGKASTVVTHGGAGSIIDILNMQKKLVIVPRLKEFSEHTNNHQLGLAEALQKQGKAIAVMDIKELGKAIKKAGSSRPRIEKDKRLALSLAETINYFEKRIGRKGR